MESTGKIFNKWILNFNIKLNHRKDHSVNNLGMGFSDNCGPVAELNADNFGFENVVKM